MYPRLRPPQRGQTKPLGQRCAVRWAAHWVSSPKRARNWLTVRMGFRFRLECFISDIISPFVRLTKLDIHLAKYRGEGVLTGRLGHRLQHRSNQGKHRGHSQDHQRQGKERLVPARAEAGLSGVGWVVADEVMAA